MAASLTSDNLRKAFLASLLLSWACMAAISFLGLPAEFLVVAPVAVMALYLHYFSNSDDKEGLQDQFADSFYSLGFLLTLTALVFTFLPLFYTGQSVTMKETLGNFGVALLTTLLGLTVRIYLTSFSADFDQIQKQIALELERDVRVFKEEMGASVTIMQEFNDDLKKTTQKTVKEFDQSLAGAGEEITKLVQSTMVDAVTPLSGAFADLSDGVKASTADFSSNLDASFNDCVQSVKDIQLEPEILRDAIRPVLDGLERSASDVEHSVESIADSLAGNSSRLDKAMSDFSSSVGAMNIGLTAGLERMVNGVETLEFDASTVTGVLEKSFEPFQTVIDEVADQIRQHGLVLEENAQAAQAVLPMYDTIKANMQSINGMNQQLNSSMIQLSDMIDQFSIVTVVLKKLANSTEEYVAIVDRSVVLHQSKSRDLENEHKSVIELRKDLDTQYQDAKKALDSLVAAFVDIARFVPTTLKNEA